jgi:hypothetical protein
MSKRIERFAVLRFRCFLSNARLQSDVVGSVYARISQIAQMTLSFYATSPFSLSVLLLVQYVLSIEPPLL